MNLLRIGSGRWAVLMTESVLDEIMDKGSAKGPKNAMLSLLTKSVPDHGPQEDNRTICWQLRPLPLLLWEFRKAEHRGAKFRVIWFYGVDRATIVCVRAFVKTSDKTPPGEILAAQELRAAYFEAVRDKTLRIEAGEHLVRRKKS
ncbi:MAG TPA: type II toxin-antitoxin system RelE/ParE family toxin [Thermoanaerobaculia bacterium]|jgi:hypothetical protein|nr:type II toxin-antitoxin system RelE/ParE family toxin [Thermoanaerobaculia bacterium]